MFNSFSTDQRTSRKSIFWFPSTRKSILWFPSTRKEMLPQVARKYLAESLKHIWENLCIVKKYKKPLLLNAQKGQAETGEV